MRHLSRNIGFPVTSFVLFVATLNSGEAEAQAFTLSSSAELTRICGTPGGSTGQLASICSQLGVAGGAPTAAGVGSQSQPNSLLISQQQLKDAQTSDEKKRRPKNGSADIVAAKWGDFSTFLTAGASTLRHHKNDFEDGYNSTIPSVTIGGGYSITKSLEAGLAFNYSNSNAQFNSGGGFNTNAYTPLMYINYLPFDNAFANLAFSYTRQDQSTDRLAVAGTTTGTLPPIQRLTTGNFNANQYTLNFLSGYDFFIENFTIGPRLGVDARQWDMNSYRESTNTGLELRYNNQHQTSIQSNLGIFASSAHNFDFGVLVPQISVSWVHEYANDSRIINAHFVQATDSVTGPGFYFQTENPARDWALIDLGASLLVQNDLQVFANVSTVQGNQNFVSYGGNVGVRVGW